MRFLFIANDFPNPWQPTKGIFNLQLVRALAQQHDVQVVSPIPWIDEWRARRRGVPPLGAKRQAMRDGIEVHHPRYYYPPKVLHSHYGWFYWHSIRATVLHLFQSHPPDVVLAYWAHPDGQAAIYAARMAKVPAAIIVGGSDVLLITRQPSRRICVIRTLAEANAVIVVSQYLKDKTIELGIPPEKVHVWRQGVDTTLFHPGDRIEARRRLNLPSEGPILLWVGRMVPVKALDVLIESCAILRSRGTAFHLYLVGDGPLRPQLQSQTAALGLLQA
ncbi:MAG: glycosyltransferase, partial [Bacillota bacterium]